MEKRKPIVQQLKAVVGKALDAVLDRVLGDGEPMYLHSGNVRDIGEEPNKTSADDTTKEC